MSSTGGWAAVDVLAEPTRRRVFDVVRAAHHPVTRDEVAAGSGIDRRLAAFHLDRLAEAGLLVVDFARPEGRGGPGAGRPAKRYKPAGVEVCVTVPPRRYNVVAEVLAEAVASAPSSAATRAGEVAARHGRDLGRAFPAGKARGGPAAIGRAEQALGEMGYEPQVEAGSVVLRNCPFHEVVAVSPELVCGLNQQLLSGMLDGLGLSDRLEAVLDPQPDRCCVALQRRG